MQSKNMSTILSLGCDGIDTTKITKDSTGYLNDNPPLLKFALMLQSEKQVLCTLYDADQILDTKNITKEGFGCVTGEKGKSKSCEECPTGETSHSESRECFSVETKCEEGRKLKWITVWSSNKFSRVSSTMYPSIT